MASPETVPEQPPATPKREGSGFLLLGGLLDALLTPTTSDALLTPATPAGDDSNLPGSALRREGSLRRKGMPSGCKSLLPEGYVPPHPKHKDLFDGNIEGRQLNVKNFYKHFCTFQPTSFNEGAVSVLEDCGGYRLPVWYSSLVTSAAPTLVEHTADYTREDLKDDLGGVVAVDWTAADDAHQHTPVLCVFPGMAGHSEKDYIRSCVQKVLRDLRWRVCVMNWRGFNSSLQSTRVSCPADISDMERVFDNATNKYPDAPLYGIGFSMGSNQLVKYLGKNAGKHRLVAAISVCNGFEYEVHINRVESTTLGQAVYSRGMTYLHQEYLRTQGLQLKEMGADFDLDRALTATTHTEFDQAVFPLYAQLFGYKDLKDYYDSVDSRPYVPSVSIPLLCIQSADDPLFTEGDVKPHQVLPVVDLHDNPNIIYFETEYGSHLNFVEATFNEGVSRSEFTFCDRAVVAFFRYASERVQVQKK